MSQAPVVFVVDDDPSERSSLKFLMSSVGLQVESFDSADALLQRNLPDAPGCPINSELRKNTVKVHRSRAMEKMHAPSVAEVVRMIAKLESSAEP